MNKNILTTIIIILAISGLAFQQFARRILPIWSNPATPCTEGSVYWHMIQKKFLICTNNGPEEVGVGTAGGVIPIADATTTGRLSNTDWILFNSKQAALGFTPENSANKNALNGYAGLSGGKVANSQISEVLSVLNLTDYSTTSGAGTTAIRSTISAAATNDVLTWNGTNWINQASLITSVFGRNGIITSQTGDYTASQITNAFDISGAETLINVAAPSNPSAGTLAIWADAVDTILKTKNSAGVLAITIRPTACAGTDKVSAIDSAGSVICTTDQTGGGGGGGNIVSLNGLTTSDQTFSTTADTNIDLTISSVGSIHSISVAWLGTLGKSRMVASTVHTDQANTFGAFAQTFQAGTLFKLIDPTNSTKVAQFDLSNISTSTTRTINVPDANSTTVQPSSAGANNFANAVSSQGVISYIQPSFSNLSGSASDAQIPDTITITGISNMVSNGFLKTSGSNGTLSVDTNTYLTGNQTITLSGNVTGSGTTAITTTIANNSITGAMIALGSDTHGDILFYNGTDWARLAAGTSGRFLQTNGAGFAPSWETVSAGSGDMILASVQTVTGAKTFDPTTLIVGSVATDPAVVIGSFYRDTDDGKLYFGVDDTVDFWGEIFIAGQSLVSLTTDVTGDLPFANLTASSAASKLLGRGSAGGAGDFQEISLDSTLTMSGTTLAVNSALAVTSLTVNGLAITNNIVQNSQSAAYTTVLSDAGKHIYHPSADTTARIFTIDSNANVAYPVGTALTFVNDCSAGTVTISITSDTLVLAGAGTTGSRTLAACGVATAIKVTTTRWIINGTGLT